MRGGAAATTRHVLARERQAGSGGAPFPGLPKEGNPKRTTATAAELARDSQEQGGRARAAGESGGGGGPSLGLRGCRRRPWVHPMRTEVPRARVRPGPPKVCQEIHWVKTAFPQPTEWPRVDWPTTAPIIPRRRQALVRASSLMRGWGRRTIPSLET